MAKSQQPELHRSGLSPADPASAKSHAETAPPATEAGTAPVPEENRPGHHPEQEQDKPVDAFVARTTRRRSRPPAGASRPTSERKRSARAAPPQVAPEPSTVTPGSQDRSRRSAPPRDPSGQSAPPRDPSGQSAPPPGSRPVQSAPPARDRSGRSAPRPGSAPVRPTPAPVLDRGALYVIVPALAMADAARRPDGAWREIGESKARWLAQIALLPGLGPWLYGSSIRPRLEAAERAEGLAGG
jgi:hypothetical protein